MENAKLKQTNEMFRNYMDEMKQRLLNIVKTYPENSDLQNEL